MGLFAWEIDRIAKLGLTPGFSTISFGHPDILASPDDLLPILGVRLPIDNQGIGHRSGMKSDAVGNARLVFGALGSQMTIVEIRKTYNVDAIVDLNFPIDLGRYDLVIDPGTSEHCFNVGQALVNMAKCVKVGGWIYHRVPLCHWNHGFWNFSPCAFNDFYLANGFDVILNAECGGRMHPVKTKKGDGGKWFSPRDGRKWQLVCTAQRIKDKDIGFPMQSKYLSA
ncbi:MAG TPA: hypothetical protein VIY48_16375 [Candidatus Paceibacterota bacterium]